MFIKRRFIWEGKPVASVYKIIDVLILNASVNVDIVVLKLNGRCVCYRYLIKSDLDLKVSIVTNVLVHFVQSILGDNLLSY